jgi:hypothetical protein
MRARQDDRRLFSRNNGCGIELNVYSLQESRHLNIQKLWQALNLNTDAQHGQTQDLLTIAQATDDPADASKRCINAFLMPKHWVP